MYLPLIESCQKAIEQGRCLGCSGLENPFYRGNSNCEYSKTSTAQESIDTIHKILGIQEKIWK